MCPVSGWRQRGDPLDAQSHRARGSVQQTDSGKCTTTGRLLFEENLGFEDLDNEADIILFKMLWKTVYTSSLSGSRTVKMAPSTSMKPTLVLDFR